MKIAALKEQYPLETRVALTPEIVKKYQALGFEVYIEKGAGKKSNFLDSQYKQQGAIIIDDIHECLSSIDCLLSVLPPPSETLSQLKKGCVVIGMLQDPELKNAVECYSKQSVHAFTLESIPRITRAQSMDCLSSQSNLSGYQAVLEACNQFNRVVPMMMTAAGMIKPANILVLGAGVAGLQAIATAKRLGGVVYAFDVRAAAKEQVESLAAEFIAVESNEDAETSGGYAKEMSEEYKQKQQLLINEYAKKCDIVISTALIPNKPAPILLTAETVKEMRAGSVIVDLATITGGNCELSIKDKVVKKHNVSIIGHANLARHLPATASELYSTNCYNFVNHLIDKKKNAFNIDLDDEIISNTLITSGE